MRCIARPVISMALLAALVLSASGCASNRGSSVGGSRNGILLLNGSVVDDLVTVSVPDLSISTSERSDDATPSPDAVMAAAPVAWSRVARVDAPVGARVLVGQPLLTFDGALPDAAEKAAQADLSRARAESGLVGALLEEIEKNRADITTQTAQLHETIINLELERAGVAVQLQAARRAAGISTDTASAPAPSQPATPTPEAIATVRRLEQAIERIDAGLEEARAGIERLLESEADLETALAGLSGAREAAAALVEAREIGLEIAAARAREAVILAPVDCLVVEVASAGSVLAAGAPAVRVRPTKPSRVETFLGPAARRQIVLGTQATVYVDSLPGRALVGRVVEIGDAYVFPPTRFASPGIHLTRAFRVLVQIETGEVLPAGTPADVMFAISVPQADGS